MTDRSDDQPDQNGTGVAAAGGSIDEPTLAEDLLLLLFQPRSGTIAGENILFSMLGGAVVADLALGGNVTTETTRFGSVLVRAAEDRTPADETLRSAWDYVSEKPRAVQSVLATVGPELRAPLLARLVERGDIRREQRTAFGLFRTTALVEGATGRRARLLEDLREVLVDRVAPRPRVAALAALVSGSGTMPQFSPEIPWDSPVIARATALQQGNWGATAAADAVMRTTTASIIQNVIVATTVLPRV